MKTFRNQYVDKWLSMNEVSTGVVVKKGKSHAFNQVATYMRDSSKMIKSMQMRRETVGVFGFSSVVDDFIPGSSMAEKPNLTTIFSNMMQKLLKRLWTSCWIHSMN